MPRIKDISTTNTAPAGTEYVPVDPTSGNLAKATLTTLRTFFNPGRVPVPVGSNATVTQALADACASSGDILYFGPGTYPFATGSLTIQCNVDASSDATITSTITSGSAVFIGSAATSCDYRTIRLPRVTRTTRGWTESSGTATVNADRGVTIRAADGCDIDVPSITEFSRGLVLEGDAQGVAYNTIRLGALGQNAVNLFLSRVNAGWSNQNTFLGGRFNIVSTTASTNLVNSRQVVLGSSTASTFQPDGNLFLGCSFEGALPEFMVECWGSNNRWVGCRWEHAAGTSKVAWRAVSASDYAQRNTIQGGYDGEDIAITADADTRSNSVMPDGGGWKLEGASPDGPMVSVMSRSSSADSAFVAFDPAGGPLLSQAASAYAAKLSASLFQLKARADAHARLQVNNALGRLYLGDGTVDPSTLGYLRYYSGTAWEFNGVSLRWAADNTHDIGVAGARPRHLNLGGYVEVAEVSEPAAPSANGIRLYAKDVGGKTQLAARFNTGAVVPLAIEGDTGPFLNVKDHGAVGDHRFVADGVIAGGSLSTLTSATAAFTAADVGKAVTVSSAGAAGVTGRLPHSTTISAYTNSTTVTLAAAASAAVTGARVDLGTDDSTAFQAAITAALAAGGPKAVYVPPGSYMAPTTLTVSGSMAFRGPGLGLATIVHSSWTKGFNVTAPNGSHVEFEDFTIQGPSGVLPHQSVTTPAISYEVAATYDSRFSVRRVQVVGTFDNSVARSGGGLFELIDCQLEGTDGCAGAFEPNDQVDKMFVLMRGTTMQCPNGDQTDQGSVGLYIHPHVPFDISNCRFLTMGRYGVYQNGTPVSARRPSSIVGCDFINAGHVKAVNNGKTVMSGCTMKGLGGLGSDIRDDDFTFDGCVFDNTGIVTVHNGATFTGCTIIDTKVSYPNGTASTAGQLLQFTGCRFRTTAYTNHFGKFLITSGSTAQRVIIDDCEFNDVTTTGSSDSVLGFENTACDARLDNVRFRGLRSNNGYGALLFQGTKLVVENCDFDGTAGTMALFNINAAEKLEGSNNRITGGLSFGGVGASTGQQRLTRRRGVNPSTVASAATINTNTAVWLNYDTHVITGSTNIATLSNPYVAVGEIKLVVAAGATWALTAAGNITPLATTRRPPGTVITLLWEPTAAKWLEVGDAATVIDVKDYGAVGDGTTDDRTAIQAALTAAKTLAAVLGTKVTVRLGQGERYRVTSAGTTAVNYMGSNSTQAYCLKIGSGVRLDLNESTIKLADSANSAVIVNDGILYTDPADANIEITNGTFDGNEANQGTAGGSAVMAVICLVNATGVQLTDLVFNDVRDGALRVWKVGYFHLDNLEVNRSDGDGFHLGTFDPAGPYDARTYQGTIGALRANNCKVGLYGSRQGNPVILSGNNVACGTWIADSCAGGFKIQDGSENMTLESCVFVGAASQTANNSSTNSGLKIQGGVAGGTSYARRITVGSVVSSLCRGQGLYIEYAEDVAVGSYVGYGNATDGTIPDVRVGTGKGRQIGSITSTNSGQQGVMVRADCEDAQIGSITVTDPSQTAASAAAVQVLNTVGVTQIGRILTRDTRGTSKTTYGLDVPTAGTLGHADQVIATGTLTAPMRLSSTVFSVATAYDGTTWRHQFYNSGPTPNRATFSNTAYTAAAGVRVIAQTGTLSAARVVTLPLANSVPAGTILQVVDESGTATGTFTLSWARAGSDTINGGTGNVVAVNAAYGNGKIMSDGTSKWTTV